MAREGDFYFQNKRKFFKGGLQKVFQRGASRPLCIPPQGEGSPCNPSTRRGSAPLAPPVWAYFVLASYKRGFKGGNAPFEMRYIE